MVKIIRDYHISKQQIYDKANSVEQENSTIKPNDAQAYEKGYSDGYDVGKQAAFEEHSLRLQQEREALRETIYKRFDQIVESSEQRRHQKTADAVDMVAAVLPQFFIEHALMKKNVEHAITQILGELHQNKPVKVYISEEDFHLLQQNLIELNLPEHLTLEASPKVQLGGCLIESPDGILDGRIESQIDKLKSVLLAYKQQVLHEPS